jgi:hypothetical protein
LLLWLGPILVATGLFTERMWRSLPATRALETLLISVLFLGIAAASRRLLRVTLATSLACLFAIILVWFVGVLPILSVLLLCAAAFSVGDWIIGECDIPSTIIAGLCVICAIVGWLLPFPVHYRFVYFSFFLIVVALKRKRLMAAVRDISTAWRSTVSEAPHTAAFAILIVGFASAVCWLPTVQFDDLAYHLGLPAQLSELHYYRMDVQSQVWALAPWSGDIAQALTQLLAGTESRGAVDAVWLLLVCVLTWSLTGLYATRRWQWFAVALAASQPLTASLCGGMQAELPATAAALALAFTVARSEAATWRNAAAFAFIAGFLLALKIGFIAIVLPLAIWFIWRCRGGWSLRVIVGAILSMLFACGSSYAYAMLVTGDPFFPLFSDALHARFPADVMSDPHWLAPFDASILWQLTFHTEKFFEGWNGAAGFSMLGLIGAAVIALCSRSMRALTACAVLAFIAAISTVHYFRYAYPALMLLTPATTAVVARYASARNAAILLSCLIVLNVAFQSCANWTLHVGGIKHRLIHRNDVAEIDRYAPPRGLVRAVRERDPNSIVLFCSPEEPFGAELAGRGFTVSHYDPELEHARLLADADSTGVAWRDIFGRTQANYAIVSHTSDDNAALKSALSDAQLVLTIGSDQLWQLPASEQTSVDLVRARDFAREKSWP